MERKARDGNAASTGYPASSSTLSQGQAFSMMVWFPIWLINLLTAEDIDARLAIGETIYTIALDAVMLRRHSRFID